MKIFFTYLIMTVMMANVLSGCADQAKAPEIDGGKTQKTTETDDAATSVTEETATETAVPETDADAIVADTTVVSELTVNSSEVFDQLALPVPGDKIAVIETDFGTIKVRLFPDLAPEISKNFEELAKANMYNAVPFHRVVKDFMIQTGDFTNKNGTGGYSYKGPGTMLADEITPALKHLYGTVSMANRGPDTNGSQFFIVTNKGGTPFLDGNYSIFGQVYEGMDVALKIADLQMIGTEKPSQTVNMTQVKVMTME